MRNVRSNWRPFLLHKSNRIAAKFDGFLCFLALWEAVSVHNANELIAFALTTLTPLVLLQTPEQVLLIAYARWISHWQQLLHLEMSANSPPRSCCPDQQTKQDSISNNEKRSKTSRAVSHAATTRQCITVSTNKKNSICYKTRVILCTRLVTIFRFLGKSFTRRALQTKNVSWLPRQFEEYTPEDIMITLPLSAFSHSSVRLATTNSLQGKMHYNSLFSTYTQQGYGESKTPASLYAPRVDVPTPTSLHTCK